MCWKAGCDGELSVMYSCCDVELGVMGELLTSGRDGELGVMEN